MKSLYTLGPHDIENNGHCNILFSCNMKTISPDDLNSSIWKELIIMQ